MKRLEELEKQVGKKSKGVEISDKGALQPLCREIYEKPLPTKFKPPTLDQYEGKTDPKDHISYYLSVCMIFDWDDATLCKLFPMSLKGAARSWYNALPPRSIHSFQELTDKF